ncbi:hypothetical protein A2V82_02215 [candidate division KSB1 bacterium RBG_16_48_16]|nr:MAG: hypothetical protein A2V82_02215 [candidate division KSB1 bacterium RBG_16_48_16]
MNRHCKKPVLLDGLFYLAGKYNYFESERKLFWAMSLRGVRNERRSNPITFQQIASAKLVLSLSKETPRNDSKISN